MQELIGRYPGIGPPAGPAHRGDAPRVRLGPRRPRLRAGAVLAALSALGLSIDAQRAPPGAGAAPHPPARAAGPGAAPRPSASSNPPTRSCAASTAPRAAADDLPPALPRRLQPRRGAVHGQGLLRDRLRRRPDALARRPPHQALAAARRRQHDPLVPLRHRKRPARRTAAAAAARPAWSVPRTCAISEPWARVWHTWVAAAFLKAYLATPGIRDLLPQAPEDLQALLEAFLFEKALRELDFELTHRIQWVRIPIRGRAAAAGGKRAMMMVGVQSRWCFEIVRVSPAARCTAAQRFVRHGRFLRQC